MRATVRAAGVAMNPLGKPNCGLFSKRELSRKGLTVGRGVNVTLGESWFASPTAIARVERPASTS